MAELRFRVQVAQLPVIYAFMVRWDEMQAKARAAGANCPMPDSLRDTYRHFIEIARKKKITILDNIYLTPQMRKIRDELKKMQ